MWIILSGITHGYKDQEIYFFYEKLRHLYAIEFVTKCFLIFIIDEVKNFAANNIDQSFWS